MTTHDFLIFIHATSGIISFIAGSALIIPPVRYGSGHRIFQWYLYSLLALIVSLLIVVPMDFPHLALAEKISFSGLSVLALYMGVRAIRAQRVGKARLPGWRLKFIDDIGFTLISLFDGFVIVSAIDLGFPAWVVGIVAVLGIVAGVRIIEAAKRRTKVRTA